MNTQDACMGCYVNDNWYRNYELINISPTPLSSVIFPNPHLYYNYWDSHHGLTDEEKECLAHLVKAWEIFKQLSPIHPSSKEDFVDGIHKCQYLVGMRVAQRVNPEVWAEPPSEGKTYE